MGAGELAADGSVELGSPPSFPGAGAAAAAALGA